MPVLSATLAMLSLEQMSARECVLGTDNEHGLPEVTMMMVVINHLSRPSLVVVPFCTQAESSYGATVTERDGSVASSVFIRLCPCDSNANERWQSVASTQLNRVNSTNSTNDQVVKNKKHPFAETKREFTSLLKVDPH